MASFVSTFTGDGNTQAFTAGFPVLRTTDLAVVVNNAWLTLGTDYYVTGPTSAAVAHLLTAPANGATVTLRSAIGYTPMDPLAGTVPVPYLTQTDDRLWEAIRDAVSAEAAARAAADAIIIASGDEPADVGLAPVIATGTSEARTVADRFADMVNVLDFAGIDPTGAGDSTSALQDAIDECAAGGTVWLPAGTYRTTGALTISKPISLVGSGRYGTTIRAASGYAAIVINNAGAAGVSWVRVADLAIKVPSGDAASKGIYAGDGTHYASNITFERLWVQGDGTNGYGIHLKFGLTGKIDNCQIDRWARGLWLDSTGSGSSNAMAISGSRFAQCASGIYGGSDDAWLWGCVLEENTGYGIYSVGGHWSVGACHFENTGATDVYFSDGGQWVGLGNEFYSGAGTGLNYVISATTDYVIASSYGEGIQGGVTNGSATSSFSIHDEKNPNGRTISGNVNVWSGVNIEINANSFFDINGGLGMRVRKMFGISATSTVCNNLRGSVSVSGTSDKGTVVFDAAETNASYFVAVTPTTISGAAAAGSTRVKKIDKRTDGFDVTVEAAPGTATYTVFDWIMVR